MLQIVKSHKYVSYSDPQLPPLRIDQRVLKTVRSHKVLGRKGEAGAGGFSQEIGAVDLAAYLRRSFTFRPRVQCCVA